MDFDDTIGLKSDQSNHKSLLVFPEHAVHYLAKESQQKPIIGPFKQPPFKDMHFGQFITRENPDSSNRTVIVDLCWPAGHSVNTGFDP